MKNYKTIAIITFIFIGIFMISCESHEQKADAFDTLKNEKQNSGNDILVNDTVYIPQNKVKTGQETTRKAMDEWTIFNRDTEKKIVANELKIKEIKSLPNIDAKTIRKIVALEKENNGLRQQMVDYIQEEKVRWATFKAKIIQDESAITLGLKDVTITK